MKNGYRKTRLGYLHYRKAKKLWTLRSDGRSGPQVSRGYARHVRKMKAAAITVNKQGTPNG